ETHLQGRHWYGHRLVIRARRILGFGVFGGYEAGGEGRPPEQNGHPGGTRDPPWCGAQQRVAEPTRPFEVSGFHEEADGRDGVANAILQPVLQPLGRPDLGECRAGCFDRRRDVAVHFERVGERAVSASVAGKRTHPGCSNFDEDGSIAPDRRDVRWCAGAPSSSKLLQPGWVRFPATLALTARSPTRSK